MAHKKGVGSSKNGRESESKRLGVKLFGGEMAKAGNIILRQRGTKHHPGKNTGIGRDHTIYALVDGIVVFRKKKDNRSYISIQETIKAGETEKIITNYESKIGHSQLRIKEEAGEIGETKKVGETVKTEEMVEIGEMVETVKAVKAVKAVKPVKARKTRKVGEIEEMVETKEVGKIEEIDEIGEKAEAVVEEADA